MVIATDNYDLFVRRKRLNLNQRDIARNLPRPCATSAISDFEAGERADLPHGQGRDEYDAILKAYERGMRAGGIK